MLERFEGGRLKEVLTVSVVGTFAAGWLLPRLQAFNEEHPFVDLRMLTNNNRVDLAAEGLDLAIRYGDGAWHGVQAEPLMDAPLAPLCSPELAARLREPRDLLGQTLLRPYRGQDWLAWFAAAGLGAVDVRGPLFDSSWIMVEAAIQGLGVALAPPAMFQPALESGRLAQPFALSTPAGGYWLTRLKSRKPTPAMEAFQAWAMREVGG
jgi:LysR family transcriptional regulator of beta-lactamase